MRIHMSYFCETNIGDKVYSLLCCPNFKEEFKHYYFQILHKTFNLLPKGTA